MLHDDAGTSEQSGPHQAHEMQALVTLRRVIYALEARHCSMYGSPCELPGAQKILCAAWLGKVEALATGTVFAMLMVLCVYLNLPSQVSYCIS